MYQYFYASFFCLLMGSQTLQAAKHIDDDSINYRIATDTSVFILCLSDNSTEGSYMRGNFNDAARALKGQASFLNVKAGDTNLTNVYDIQSLPAVCVFYRGDLVFIGEGVCSSQLLEWHMRKCIKGAPKAWLSGDVPKRCGLLGRIVRWFFSVFGPRKMR